MTSNNKRQIKFEKSAILTANMEQYQFSSDEVVSIRRTQYRLIEKHIQDLPQKTQLVCQMTLFEKLAPKEICHVLNICSKTYYNNLLTIARHVKKKLKTHFF